MFLSGKIFPVEQAEQAQFGKKQPEHLQSIIGLEKKNETKF
jgi:hypothetical protein